jgi:hypothetical protein
MLFGIEFFRGTKFFFGSIFFFFHLYRLDKFIGKQIQISQGDKKRA